MCEFLESFPWYGRYVAFPSFQRRISAVALFSVGHLFRLRGVVQVTSPYSFKIPYVSTLLKYRYCHFMQRHCGVIVAISLYAYLFPLCAAGRLSTYPGSTTVEHITDCLWRSISSGIVICPPSGSCLPLATGHLLSAIDHSPFAIRHSPFAKITLPEAALPRWIYTAPAPRFCSPCEPCFANAMDFFARGKQYQRHPRMIRLISFRKIINKLNHLIKKYTIN